MWEDSIMGAMVPENENLAPQSWESGIDWLPTPHAPENHTRWT